MNCFSKYFLVLISLLSACSGCENKPKPQPKVQPQPEVYRPKAPEFNADSAYAFIKAQVDFGPRVPNTKAHTECAEYLINKLKGYTANVTVQKGTVTTFNNVKLNIQNIIAQFNPQAKNRILLFAHWDTRPWADRDTARTEEPILGADDAGSGVGTLLEVARQLSNQNLPVGVDIAFFDAEDYGEKGESQGEDTYALGTQFWCRNPEPAGYTANYGILLDMTGAKNATFLKEGHSVMYASNIVNKVWETAAKLGFSNFFLNQPGGTITDDHVYPNKILGIPSIDIINQNPATLSFASHWHTHADNMEIIDKNTLKAVGQTLLEVIFSEGAAI
jgi:Zn-dependent M28 family amino/carboxypeptidase